MNFGIPFEAADCSVKIIFTVGPIAHCVNQPAVIQEPVVKMPVLKNAGAKNSFCSSEFLRRNTYLFD
jgi:hypothetical protein